MARTQTNTPSTQAARAILDSVFADPDNIELRRICGDRLAELGDPRGELIALQFAARDAGGVGTADQQMRIAELIRKHANMLAGPLGPIGKAERIVLELGFVSSITTERAFSAVTTAEWRASLETPYWATVKRLIITDRAPNWWLRDWLASPYTRHVPTLDLRKPHANKPDIIFTREPPKDSAAEPFHIADIFEFRNNKLPMLFDVMSAEQLDIFVRDLIVGPSQGKLHPIRAKGVRPVLTGAIGRKIAASIPASARTRG